MPRARVKREKEEAGHDDISSIEGVVVSDRQMRDMRYLSQHRVPCHPGISLYDRHVLGKWAEAWGLATDYQRLCIYRHVISELKSYELLLVTLDER